MSLVSNLTVDGIPIERLSDGSEKRVALRCDSCGAAGNASYSNYRASQKRYGRSGETYCKSCSNKRNGEARRGVPVPNACKPRSSRGDRHANYGDGRFLASDGYVMVRVGVRQYEREHILVMEGVLGRPIDRRVERVHHVDLDKSNNAPSNLALMASELEHKRAHRSLESVAAGLVRDGVIVFDRASGVYVARKDDGTSEVA